MIHNRHDIADIIIPATTDHLGEVRRFISDRMRTCGCNEFEEHGVILAVDEACSNLMLHAYQNDPSKSIALRIDISDTGIDVRIMDTARPFDPSSTTLPNMTSYFEERRSGGLGILIMSRVMDEISYRTTDNGMNELLLRKKRRP
ncbi:MAG: ATP-binding protein [Candidatus Kapabacteria bacterium]|jgi:serine/threonine-protein kinase RsbW|nr:ATP-binding protein [Candidatus Kapabacteria bacterium]